MAVYAPLFKTIASCLSHQIPVFQQPFIAKTFRRKWLTGTDSSFTGTPKTRWGMTAWVLLPPDWKLFWFARHSTGYTVMPLLAVKIINMSTFRISIKKIFCFLIAAASEFVQIFTHPAKVDSVLNDRIIRGTRKFHNFSSL
jgi:hypothetical protein